MSQRRNHTPNCKDSICDRCEAKAHATPGKYHRRCPGQPGLPIRVKHSPAVKEGRGKWQ
jgi:hypothetical protein